MTEYRWPDERDRATQLFNGDTPGPDIEAAVIRHFEHDPHQVALLITAIGRRVDRGQVHSGWAILRAELDRIPPAIVVHDTSQRLAALKKAELWLRNAGGYIDRQPELEDELYGHHGILRDWPDTKPQMIALWHELRPRFVKAEADHNAYMRRLTAASNGNREHAARVAAEVDRARQAAATVADPYYDSIELPNQETEAA